MWATWYKERISLCVYVCTCLPVCVPVPNYPHPSLPIPTPSLPTPLFHSPAPRP